jgi:hypothetical protein
VAVAPKHREHRADVHRPQARGIFGWGEWTTTQVTVEGRGTVGAQRYIAGSTVDEDGKLRGSWVRKQVVHVRSPNTGFRCAR